jgi:retinol dehydrogenase 13
MNKRSRSLKYFKEYNWADILAMIRNNKAMPETCEDSFRGKNVVITGATSGIGYSTARKYASGGANLLCINRNEEKSEALCKEIQADFAVTCDYKIADMSRMEDVHRTGRELAELDSPIDVLIHNAGIYITKRELTVDGFEAVFFVNYLSSFILNYILMEKLKSQDRTRILLVNSEGHRFVAWGLNLDDLNWEKHHYTGLRGYGSAKMAQLLSMIVFDDIFKQSGVTINAMHPGAVKSHSGTENGPLYRWFRQKVIDKNVRSPEISAEALYYLGISKEVEGRSGKFFNLTTEETPAPPALDKETAEELWKLSLRFGGLDT